MFTADGVLVGWGGLLFICGIEPRGVPGAKYSVEGEDCVGDSTRSRVSEPCVATEKYMA